MRTIMRAYVIRRATDGLFCYGGNRFTSDLQKADIFQTYRLSLQEDEEIVPVWISGVISTEPPN